MHRGFGRFEDAASFGIYLVSPCGLRVRMAAWISVVRTLGATATSTGQRTAEACQGRSRAHPDDQGRHSKGAGVVGFGGSGAQRVRLAARAHIPVRTSLPRHIHVPLPGHTRCIASCFEGAASLGATSEYLARAQPVGQGSRERRGCLPPEAAQRSAVADQLFRLRSHGHSSRPLRHADRSPAPHISRRTPCSGYPAASTDMDVRPRGDPDTRSTAAPSGAVAVARMLLLLLPAHRGACRKEEAPDKPGLPGQHGAAAGAGSVRAAAPAAGPRC